MNDSRKVKSTVVGITVWVEGSVKATQIEWVNDIEDWCRTSLQELNNSIQNRTERNKI